MSDYCSEHTDWRCIDCTEGELQATKDKLDKAVFEGMEISADLSNKLKATKDKLKQVEDHDKNVMRPKVEALEDKLKACEAERDRTVNGYAEEQLKLLGQITALEAERDKLKEIYGIAACEFQKLNKDFHALEKIAREGLVLHDGLFYNEAAKLEKKIDELTGKSDGEKES